MIHIELDAADAPALRQYVQNPDRDELERLVQLFWNGGLSAAYQTALRSAVEQGLDLLWAPREFFVVSAVTGGRTDGIRTFTALETPGAGIARSLDRRVDQQRSIYLSAISDEEFGSYESAIGSFYAKKSSRLTHKKLMRSLSSGGSVLYISSHSWPAHRLNDDVLALDDGSLRLSELEDAKVGRFDLIVVSGCASVVPHPASLAAGISLASWLGARAQCPVIGTAAYVYDVSACCFAFVLMKLLFEDELSILDAWGAIEGAIHDGRFLDLASAHVATSRWMGGRAQSRLLEVMRTDPIGIGRDVASFRLLA